MLLYTCMVAVSYTDIIRLSLAYRMDAFSTSIRSSLHSLKVTWLIEVDFSFIYELFERNKITSRCIRNTSSYIQYTCVIFRENTIQHVCGLAPNFHPRSLSAIYFGNSFQIDRLPSTKVSYHSTLKNVK